MPEKTRKGGETKLSLKEEKGRREKREGIRAGLLVGQGRRGKEKKKGGGFV